MKKMIFWKKKSQTPLNSTEYEEIHKRLVGMRSDIDIACNRIEVINAVVKSNRSRINQIKCDKVISETEDNKKGEPVYL